MPRRCLCSNNDGSVPYFSYLVIPCLVISSPLSSPDSSDSSHVRGLNSLRGLGRLCRSFLLDSTSITVAHFSIDAIHGRHIVRSPVRMLPSVLICCRNGFACVFKDNSYFRKREHRRVESERKARALRYHVGSNYRIGLLYHGNAVRT